MPSYILISGVFLYRCIPGNILDTLTLKIYLLWTWNANLTGYFVFFKIFYLFLEWGESKEKERERNTNVQLPLVFPQMGIWLASQACFLTGNWTCDPLVYKPMLNPPCYTRQGFYIFFFDHLAPNPTMFPFLIPNFSPPKTSSDTPTPHNFIPSFWYKWKPQPQGFNWVWLCITRFDFV